MHKCPLGALRCSPRPQTRGSQVSGTAPPLAAGAPATTPLECGPRAAGRAGPISNLWPSPRPASGLGVSGQGWVEAAAPASPRLRSRPESRLVSKSAFWPATAVSAGAGSPARPAGWGAGGDFVGGPERRRPLRFLVDSSLARERGRPGDPCLAWEPGVVCVKGGVRGR